MTDWISYEQRGQFGNCGQNYTFSEVLDPFVIAFWKVIIGWRLCTCGVMNVNKVHTLAKFIIYSHTLKYGVGAAVHSELIFDIIQSRPNTQC